MFRKVLLSTAAAFAMVGSALAADLPARVTAPAPFIPPVFTWTGFYIGVNAGAAWVGHDGCSRAYDYYGGVYTPISDYRPNCNNNNDNVGFIGGGQAGYNWQMGGLVLGVEGDIDWVGRAGNRNYDYAMYGDPYRVGRHTYEVDNDSFHFNGGDRGNVVGTIRGRIGFALDRALFYVTGGAAFRGNGNDGNLAWTHDSIVNNTYTGTVTTTTTTTNFTRNNNNNNVGWVLGGGIEYALSDNVTVRAEYMHMQFDNNSGYYTNSYYPRYAFSSNRNNSLDTARLGLNWKFGWAQPTAVSPVSARY